MLPTPTGTNYLLFSLLILNHLKVKTFEIFYVKFTLHAISEVNKLISQKKKNVR